MNEVMSIPFISMQICYMFRLNTSMAATIARSFSSFYGSFVITALLLFAFRLLSKFPIPTISKRSGIYLQRGHVAHTKSYKENTTFHNNSSLRKVAACVRMLYSPCSRLLMGPRYLNSRMNIHKANEV